MPYLLFLANELLQCEMENYSQLSDHKTRLDLFCGDELFLSHLIKPDPRMFLSGNKTNVQHQPQSAVDQGNRQQSVRSIFRLLSKLALRVWDLPHMYERGKKHIWLALQVLLWHQFYQGKSSESIQVQCFIIWLRGNTEPIKNAFSIHLKSVTPKQCIFSVKAPLVRQLHWHDRKYQGF